MEKKSKKIQNMLKYPLKPKSFLVNSDDVPTGNRINTSRWTTGNVPTRNWKRNAYQKMDDRTACAPQSFLPREKLHFTCAAVQASNRPSVSRLSLQQPPHHMHQVRPHRDLDALTPACNRARFAAWTTSVEGGAKKPTHSIRNVCKQLSTVKR